MQNSINKRIAQNTLVLCVRMVIVLCINLYTTRLTLDALGIDNYGIYNVVCGFVSMFTFLNTSMANGIQRFYNYEYGKKGVAGAKKVYIHSLVVQAILVLTILLLTETLGLWYVYNKMVIPLDRFEATLLIYQLSILSFIFIIMQVPYTAAIMAHEKMGFYAFIGLLDAGLKLLIAKFIPYADCDSLVLYGVLLTLVSLIDFILVFTYSKLKFEEIKFEKKFELHFFKSMLSFSGWNILGSFSGMMREQGLNVILNLFFGPAVNAARGVAYQVASGLQGFVANAGVAVRPQIIQSYAQNNELRTINLMLSLSKVGILALFILSYPIILEINFVLNLWLGNEVPEHTASFIILVVLISYVNNMNSAVSAVVHATGQMKKYQTITSLITILSLPVAYYTLDMGCEPESVFWVSLLFTILMQIASLFILKNLVDFSLKKYVVKVLLPTILVVAISAPLPFYIHYITPEGWGRFLFVILSSMTISIIVSYIIALNKKEKSLVNSIITRFIPKKLKTK